MYTINGTEWPYMCRSVVKNLLTHSLTHSRNWIITNPMHFSIADDDTTIQYDITIELFLLPVRPHGTLPTASRYDCRV